MWKVDAYPQAVRCFVLEKKEREELERKEKKRPYGGKLNYVHNSDRKIKKKRKEKDTSTYH